MSNSKFYNIFQTLNPDDCLIFDIVQYGLCLNSLNFFEIHLLNLLLTFRFDHEKLQIVMKEKPLLIYKQQSFECHKALQLLKRKLEKKEKINMTMAF